MKIDDSNWTYNEFLAFLLIYGAEMNYPLTKEELAFIKNRTSISDIEKIKNKVESVSDSEAIEIIDDYCKRFLDTPAKKDKVRADLEDLLNTGGLHSQLEKAGIHILEKFIC